MKTNNPENMRLPTTPSVLVSEVIGPPAIRPVKKHRLPPYELAALGQLADVIRDRAYELWELAGKPPGDGVEYWIKAEDEILER